MVVCEMIFTGTAILPSLRSFLVAVTTISLNSLLNRVSGLFAFCARAKKPVTTKKMIIEIFFKAIF